MTEDNEIEEKTMPGTRFASGRPQTGRTHAISVRISQEAMEMLADKHNKSEYIDGLIKKDNT